MKYFNLFVGPFFALALMSAENIHAESPPAPATEKAVGLSAPYIKLKPKDGIFKVVVLGDSLASGLHQGITRLNKDNDRIETTKKARVNTGFVRVDRYDWNKGALKIAKSGKYQVAIALLGLNDLQSFREKGKAYHFQTDGWVERYRERTERMMRDLKSAGLAVYWMGIPITSPKRYQKEYEYLNGFYREAALKVGVRFIDTWKPLADKSGQYSAFWKDADGKQQEIRRKDGVHFTSDGYLIFAGFVNDIMLKDMATVMPSILEPTKDDTKTE